MSKISVWVSIIVYEEIASSCFAFILTCFTKVTGFRTRTILCHPVLSSSNVVLGVIQMVNKKRGDAKELREKAKKKKSDEKNKGWLAS